MKQLITLGLFLLMAVPAFAQVTATGVGTVFAKPDCAHLSFVVSTQHTVASKAHITNRQVSEKLFKVFSDNKIDSKDVYTTGFHISPVYDDKGAFKHYSVNHNVSVKIRDLKDVGAIIDNAVFEEARLQNIAFHVTNRKEMEEKARDLALADAKKKAQQMTRRLDSTIGVLKSVTEQQSYDRSYGVRADALGAAPGTRVAAGDQAITVGVTASWDVVPQQEK